MAKDSGQNNITLSKTALSAIEALNKSNSEIASLTHNLDASDLKDDQLTKDRIKELEATVRKTFSNLLGKDNDISSDEINHLLAIASTNGKQKRENDIEQKKRFDEFKKVISTQNNKFLTDMVSTRKHNKKQLYASYDLILSIIPKMKLAVTTWVNSIISPDDFTKSVLNVVNSNTELSSKDTIFFKKATASLIERFSIESNLKQDIQDFLIKGELFFNVISLNEELQALLKENVDHTTKPDYKTITSKFLVTQLNEDVNGNADKELEFLKEGKKLFTNDKLTSESFINEMNFIIENGMVIGSSKEFLSEDAKMENEFTSNNYFREKEASDKQVDKLKLSTDSAMVKKLLPENIVKLEFNDKCFGYVYVDSVVDENINGLANNMGNGQQNINITTNSPMGTVLYSGKDTPANSEGLGQMSGELGAAMDAKLQFIASAFANRLSVDQNISLLKNNEELKNAIYNSLKVKRLIKQDKLRVTFFKPSEIIHIDRGSSIFDNILFFAKLYIASLITILMQNIIRGGDKRAYYVDTGLENDIANTVQQVIKDVKSKDITGIHNMDIFSILNIVGETSDYYFPTIDDTKPVTIDTVAGLQNPSLDNDFLNWLSNNIFSGMGLPSAYLTEVENVDFAKTLSMQNTRFIRDIVSEQVILGKGYTTLVQKIYYIEYTLNEKNTSKKDKDTEEENDEETSLTDRLAMINVADIKVSFPSPMSLNMTNLNDQISNLSSFIDPIVETIDWGKSDKEKAVAMLKGEMMRQYIPNVDWNMIDGIVSKIKKDLNVTVIKNNIGDKKDATDMADGAGIDTGTDDTSTDTGDGGDLTDTTAPEEPDLEG
jgi:hypothetical protein